MNPREHIRRTRTLTQVEILWFEIESSPIASRISIDWIQTIYARYIAWKVNRKYARYIASRRTMERIMAEYANLPTRQ